MAVAAASHAGAHWETPVVATSYASHPVTTHVEKHVIPGRTYTEVQPQYKVVDQPYVTKVGDQVHNIPTGHSYQSSSVVHTKKVVTPILAQGVKQHVVEAEPIYKTYQEPSIVKTIATQKQVAYEAPVAYHQAAPLAYSAYQAAPVAYSAPHAYQTYAAAAPVAYSGYAHAAPVISKTIAPVAYSGYAHAAPVAYSGYAHASPLITKTLAAPVAYSGYAHSAPVVKSVWGNTAGYAAAPYSYANTVASPYTAAYGVKTIAAPYSAYGYGLNAGVQAW